MVGVVVMVVGRMVVADRVVGKRAVVVVGKKSGSGGRKDGGGV